MKKIVLMMLVCIYPFICMQAQERNIRYVKPSGTNGDGTSWETASTYLQKMIDELAGLGEEGEVWVAGGTYIPDQSLCQLLNISNDNNEKHKCFLLRNKVYVYGGFEGTETERSERDWVENPTVLDGLGKIYHVVVSTGDTGEEACLDGFVIKGGKADGHGNITYGSELYYYGHGGGIYINNSSPILAHLIIHDNYSEQGGGGIFLYVSKSTIVNCLLYNNEARTNRGATGAGIYSSDSHISIINSTIAHNKADQYGSGIDIVDDNNNNELNENNKCSSLFIANSIIWGNEGGNELRENTNFFVNNSCWAKIDHCIIEQEDLKNKEYVNHICGDPKFVDKDVYNYRLIPESPGVDKGNNDHINADIYKYGLGKANRILNEKIDIGAYETLCDEEEILQFVTDENQACEKTLTHLELLFCGEVPWSFSYKINNENTEKTIEDIADKNYKWSFENLTETTTFTIVSVKDKNGSVDLSEKNLQGKITIEKSPDPVTIHSSAGATIYINSKTELTTEGETTGTWDTSDPEILNLNETDNKMIITGLKTGEATVTYTQYSETLECPGVSSIIIKVINRNTPEEPDPEPEPPLLQWSVSTTTSSIDQFRDIPNDMITEVEEGTPVYLQIRPLTEDNPGFDSWEIDYTAEPESYHYDMKTLKNAERFNFNETNPHVLVGEYIYTVTRLKLYNNGYEVYNRKCNETIRHTIIINEKQEPVPNPDPWISIGIIADVCFTETEMRIPFFTTYPDKDLEYIIRFSEEALAAGFENNTEYQPLPKDNYFTVPVSSTILPGDYMGNILVREKGDLSSEDSFPFRFKVLEGIQITKQPQSVLNACGGDGIQLSVEATGNNLSYQWYYNDKKIEGATLDYYESVVTSNTTGTYYVVVNSDCGAIRSDKVMVSENGFAIYNKWDDVLYVQNTDNKYVSFQWYKDGQPIAQYGTSVYYTVPEGLAGVYSVRARLQDNTYVESCEFPFYTNGQLTSLSVYPNIINRYENLTIESDEKGESYMNGTIDIFNYLGQKVYSASVNNQFIQIPMKMQPGNYIVHITSQTGNKKIKKIIVK